MYVNSNNLAKFEWENEIPFKTDVVNRTLHALLGEGERPGKPDHVLSLISYNTEGKKWGLNCTGPEHNDAFGTHSFGQVNSSFSIQVKAVGDNTQMKITVSAREGNFYGGSNQSYLQAECDKFIKALSYYLDNQNLVDEWHNVTKPQSIEANKNAANSGCMVIIPLFMGAGALLTYLLS